MEKRCEFCKALRPVVFCKSDAAHLCLSCDAKVHSANALSYRHPRTLVCESCRFQPALVRCSDHQMFMCQRCDITHHVSSDHHMKIVSCYVGCPSAKDLAELWGLDLKDQSIAALYAESAVGNDEKHQKNSTYLILQQIMELKRLQLSESTDHSCSAHVKERQGGPPLRQDASWKEHGILQNHLEQSDGPLPDKTEEPLSSPFPQLDAGNPSTVEPFWQCRSPLQNNEIWLQNIQDLGVCDEVQCFDEVNIPDVDLTFRNFEELFGDDGGGDTKKPPSSGKFESDRVEKKQDEGVSLSPSSSFSVSRITGESSGSDELTPAFPEQQGWRGRERERCKEKTDARHEQQRPSKCDFKKRGKSRVLKKVEGLEADSGTF